jgi:NAD(P)H-hydrate epimerase
VSYLNEAGAPVISIDLPSGLYVDRSSKDHVAIRATFTLSFECYKLALLVQENAGYIGEVHILPIGLHPGFFTGKDIATQLITRDDIRQLYRARKLFAHKGNFGHSLLIAGSYGKMGAAVLSAKACLHSGTGLLTCYIPKCGYVVMQTAVPEAMVLTDENENVLTQLPDEIEKYDAIGIGPGIGTSEPTQKLLSFIVRRYQKPLVIDADGLNCISMHQDLLNQLPPFSILTPHHKEFDRLTRQHENDFERIEAARALAKSQQLIVVLKGHHTLIAMPGGSAWFNSTGNAGMARGGSGDVLTGIITSLVAQGYEPVAAALMGVYLHGLAGDAAAASYGQDYMLPSEIIGFLPSSFRMLERVDA